jgi:hypothetical protein
VLRELASDNRSDPAVLASIVQFATVNGVPSDGTSADATYISATYVDVNGTSLNSVGSGGAFPASARGVAVTVSSQVPTVLPGFVRTWQVLVQGSASALATPTSPPNAAPLVIPVAILAGDARSAYAAHTPFDLFAGGRGLTLNLASSGAPSFGSMPTSVQYWSDGQHSGTWQLSQPASVSRADAAYYDSVAAGLRDNVRRQALTDSSGAAYALVTLPIYDTSTPTTVHVVGFAQLKVRSADISSTSIRGIFLPYPAAAWGTPIAPSPDLGSAVVTLVG